jgi:predicted transcriptional regulator
MFNRCIKCERIGQDCVPNLLALPWADLLNWWKERQKYLGWTNQTLSEESGIPVGTINRIKAGEDDARYSTMRSIIHALLGGYSVEFPCQKKLDQEFATIETLEKRCAELASVNEGFNAQLQEVKDEAQKKIDYLRLENDRKAKIIEKMLEK